MSCVVVCKMLMRLLTLHHTATHWSCDITYAYDTAHTATRRNTQLHSAHVMSHTPVAVTSAAAPLAAAGAAPLLQTAKAVAVCCSVLQYIILQCAALCFSMLCCSVLQCAAVFFIMLQNRCRIQTLSNALARTHFLWCYTPFSFVNRFDF